MKNKARESYKAIRSAARWDYLPPIADRIVQRFIESFHNNSAPYCIFNYDAFVKYPSMGLDIVANAFSWKRTMEGYDYWCYIASTSDGKVRKDTFTEGTRRIRC